MDISIQWRIELYVSRLSYKVLVKPSSPLILRHYHMGFWLTFGSLCLLRPEMLWKIHFCSLGVLSLSLHVPADNTSKYDKCLQGETSPVPVADCLLWARLLSIKDQEILDFTWSFRSFWHNSLPSHTTWEFDLSVWKMYHYVYLGVL